MKEPKVYMISMCRGKEQAMKSVHHLDPIRLFTGPVICEHS